MIEEPIHLYDLRLCLGLGLGLRLGLIFYLIEDCGTSENAMIDDLFIDLRHKILIQATWEILPLGLGLGLGVLI